MGLVNAVQDAVNNWSTMMYRLHERYTIPGTIKQGYLVKSPPLEKKTLKVRLVFEM